MLNCITPEQAGISSTLVEKFIKTLESRGLVMHSVLMMRGNDIFAEYYWKPFHKDFNHRMYSQTKSYVGVAIGLLEEDGKLQLDDPVYKYFPEKIERELPPYLKELTIKNLLTMETAGDTPSWFSHQDRDRAHIYFNENSADHPAGMFFAYDSPGSELLCILVEKLSGQTLFDFLNDRIFKHLDAFKTAEILKVKNDDSFGDSALLCTTRDMAAFARFVMNYGVWNGKRLMNEEYLRTATSKVVDNLRGGFDDIYTEGYGYQIWSARHGGFAFNGMGGQLTVCIPEKDFIFTCTADIQGFGAAKSLILTAMYEIIYDNLEAEALPENKLAFDSCQRLKNELELFAMKGEKTAAGAEKINGKTFVCNENQQGIKEFSLHFNDDGTGEFHYINEQGAKVLPFGMCKNVFGKFPQERYSTLHAGLPNEEGYLYDCAASAAWREDNKLIMKVQIIDKYFGNFTALFSFKDDVAIVLMNKTAEAFLNEYTGRIFAKLKQISKGDFLELNKGNIRFLLMKIKAV